MSDLIDRQDAIDAVNNIMPTKEGFYEPCEVLEELMRLPSAQPEESMNCAFCKLSRCESDKECHWEVRWNDADANT